MPDSRADFETLAWRSLAIAAAVVASLAALLALLWNDRVELDRLGLETADTAPRPGAVSLTWFGVSTLLFDDGETQILVDGYFSRPGIADIVFDRPVVNDAATINYVLHEYRMRRLAAIIPAHTHYDHAMDVGAIANRSKASILGSVSTANVARGAGVPEDQIVVVEPTANEFTFGQFTVRLIETQHAPFGWRGRVPFDGVVAEPLVMPAAVSAWREGGCYSIVISHPQGTAIVQGSAGFTDGALDDVKADVVLLGVAMLDGLGRDYAERYWQALVTATGARQVIPIHFDDVTRPFGDIRSPPKIIDNFGRTATWLEAFRQRWDQDTEIVLPPFGRAIMLYPSPEETPEA